MVRSWSGVGQELASIGQEVVKSWSIFGQCFCLRVCQDFVRSLSEVGQELVRSLSEVGQELVRSWSGVGHGLVIR